MKLLDWMHDKFRQKDFTIGKFCNCATGQTAFDDVEYYTNSKFSVKPSTKTQRGNHLQNSFACREAEPSDVGEESSAALSELFHGFLTVGTLGIDQFNPPTPTFSVAAENVMEKVTKVTQSELMMLEDELEKALGDEDREESCDDTSGRNSRDSAIRSSHGSIITLSGEPLEGTANYENGTNACPLQNYLFNSAINLPESTKAKEGRRSSLRKLFQENKMTEDGSGGKCDKGEKETEKKADKSAFSLMKKSVRRNKMRSSSQHNAAISGVTISPQKKQQKILSMFNREGQSEISAASKKSQTSLVHEITSKSIFEGYKNGNRVVPEEDGNISALRTIWKKGNKTVKSQSNSPKSVLTATDLDGSKGCWIRTDADYLVLEL